MPSIAYKFAHRRVLVVEEVVEEWQIDHEEAKRACDIEDLVRETADLREPVERTLSHLEKGFRNGSLRGENPSALISLAHLVGSLLSKTLDLFPRVQRLAEDVQKKGYSISGLESLEDSRVAVAELRDTFYKRWQLPDKKVVETAKQELKSGKYRVL
jgi:hypothetical protein